MLSKRIFWLTCAAAVSWLIWMRLRQRQTEFTSTTPHFAPPRTFTPAIPQPDHDKTPAVTPAAAPSVANQPPASLTSADMETDISGYCMRCKTKRLIQNAQRETTESGRPAARGTCPVCGANMFTFLATNDDA